MTSIFFAVVSWLLNSKLQTELGLKSELDSPLRNDFPRHRRNVLLVLEMILPSPVTAAAPAPARRCGDIAVDAAAALTLLADEQGGGGLCLGARAR